MKVDSMKQENTARRLYEAGMAVAIGASILLAGCGGSDGSSSLVSNTPTPNTPTPNTPTPNTPTPNTPTPNTPSPGTPSLAVQAATCGTGDKAEQYLQGQVTLADRVAGFKGYNCNLTQTAATFAKEGHGKWRQFVYVRDRAGHLCGYAGSAYWTESGPGTIVVDLTDPNHSVQTATITTPGLILPAEGIRTHEGRGLLVAAYYNNVPNGADHTPPSADAVHGFDVYDVGTDCRYPQQLASTTSIMVPTDKATKGTSWPQQDKIYGHEGALSPDGLTYYVSDVPHMLYHAIDISEPTNPKYLASFNTPAMMQGKVALTHGLSVSSDGNRVYAASADVNADGSPTTPTTGEWYNGFAIFDSSAIQARTPKPELRQISEAYWYDGAITQMTIPVKINGKPYIITTEEAGSGQISKEGIKAACAAGRTPYGKVRIFDASDETKPKQLKDIVLEVNDPKNCDKIAPEVATMSGRSDFTYDTHMCSVDNRDDATTMACSYFYSGIRVYDIRDPANVKEIAYYNPPAKEKGSILWCGAIPLMDASTGMLYSNCGDGGVMSLKFTNGVWPFAKSTTPRDKQL